MNSSEIHFGFISTFYVKNGEGISWNKVGAVAQWRKSNVKQ